MKDVSPRDTLPRKLLPRRGRKPPLYHYGFPFTHQYAVEYARRHHLTIPVADEDREVFGGRTVLDMADISDAWMQADEDIRLFAECVSCSLMLKDLGRRCGFVLIEGRPFSKDWEGIVALWSNRNVKERFEWCPDYEKVVDTLKDAMNEVPGYDCLNAQWWFDFDNDVVRLKSVDETMGG